MSDDKTRVLTAEELARVTAAAGADDGRTRVLSAEEAARILAAPKAEAAPKPKAAPPEDREPKFIGSKIVFFCDNGHKITVDRSLAGKHGKCQGMAKQGCGVAFVVPVPPDFEPQADVPAPPAEPAIGWEPAPPEEAAAEAAEPLSFDLGTPAEQSSEAPAEAAAPTEGWDFGGAPPAPADESPADTDGEPAAEADADAGVVGWAIDIDEIDNPTARLVARLWLERAHGGIVEVHLSGGSVIMPEWYEPRWSCGTHALFAAQAADGTLTLTAVAWDQVQKVVVRQVQGTPDGMF